MALEKHFGTYDGTGAFDRVFNVKCADVIAVKVGNVKTVRTTRPGGKCGQL